MTADGGQRRESASNVWLVLAGAGAAAALYAAWAAARRSRPAGAVGAHAWLIPTERSRTEGEWTRRALGHASESKA